MSSYIYTQTIDEFLTELDPDHDAYAFWNDPVDPECYEEIDHFEGENHPMYGRKHSEESKQLMSEGLRGNTCHLGHKHSPETKEKMRKAKLGKVPWNKGKKGTYSPSPEAREKMSRAKLGNTFAKKK